jgi:hypothetical protein
MRCHCFVRASVSVCDRPLGLGKSGVDVSLAAAGDAATSPKLTVTYKGGEQNIVVDPKTPIVALAPGAQTDLKLGAEIIARAHAA